MVIKAYRDRRQYDKSQVKTLMAQIGTGFLSFPIPFVLDSHIMLTPCNSELAIMLRYPELPKGTDLLTTSEPRYPHH